MRPVILIIGILVIIAGVVIAEVPFDQSGSKTITPTSPIAFHISQHVAVVPNEPVVLIWSSSAPVTVAIQTCSSINSNAPSIWSQCTGGSNQTQTGTSGSWSTSLPAGGGYLWIGIVTTAGSGTSPTVSTSVKTSVPTGALGLWVIGALIVIAGVLLRRRKVPAPSPETPVPSGVEGGPVTPREIPPPTGAPAGTTSTPPEEEEEPLT